LIIEISENGKHLNKLLKWAASRVCIWKYNNFKIGANILRNV